MFSYRGTLGKRRHQCAVKDQGHLHNKQSMSDRSRDGVTWLSTYQALTVFFFIEFLLPSPLFSWNQIPVLNNWELFFTPFQKVWNTILNFQSRSDEPFPGSKKPFPLTPSFLFWSPVNRAEKTWKKFQSPEMNFQKTMRVLSKHRYYRQHAFELD